MNVKGFLKGLGASREPIATELEWIYYVLAKEFSISLDTINKLPLPYLFGLVKCHTILKKREDKEYKKMKKK